jgi:antitoxin component of RelBE/YafQ-DinJ toxin-antitoxin module
MGTKRNAPDDGRTAFLHVRIDPSVLDRYREVAEADHRTVSQDVRHLVEQRIAEADAPALKAA